MSQFAQNRHSSGQCAIAKVRASGRWPDGVPLGRGHSSPYLQSKYADMILDGTKTVEGRPGGGFTCMHGKRIAPGDYINFKVSRQGKRKVAVSCTVCSPMR